MVKKKNDGKRDPGADLRMAEQRRNGKCGAFGAWGASRWLKSMLFGVSEQNPAMMFAAGAAVIAIAALAASLPLWRATRVDAVHYLRDG